MRGITVPVNRLVPRKPLPGQRLLRSWQRSWLNRFLRAAREVDLTSRALGFAALGLVTLVPLLIVVAAAYPVHGEGFAEWLVDGMGVTGAPATAVRSLFSAPQRVLSTTSAFSVVAAAGFGLSFASCLQSGYERIWELPPGRWHSVWRRGAWLTALTACLFADVHSASLLRHGWIEGTVRALLTFVTGIALFWWGQYLLLDGRLGPRALLPGAVLTSLGLVGLRVVSSLFFAPLLAGNAIGYGPIGTVLMVQTWMIGSGTVVFGGALLGRLLSEARSPEDHVRHRRLRITGRRVR